MTVSHGTYFEDVVVGDETLTPAMTLTEAHAALYRGLTGDAPDDPAAIPDLLPLCLSTGLGWRIARPPLVVLAFMGFEWAIHRPLRVGDTVVAIDGRKVTNFEDIVAGVFLGKERTADGRRKSTFLVERDGQAVADSRESWADRGLVIGQATVRTEQDPARRHTHPAAGVE